MRFLFDEGLPFRFVTLLREAGHDVSVCGRDHPLALEDRQVLAIAYAERRILLTNDKDFGDIVFRDGHPHAGVILFRLGYVPIETRLIYLRRVLIDYAGQLDQFIVVTPQSIRVAPAAITRGDAT